MSSPNRYFYWHCLVVLCALMGAVEVHGQVDFPDVSATGSISSRSIYTSELLQFTISIQNKADARKTPDASLRHLILASIPDSYSLISICVSAQSPSLPESCHTGAEFKGSQNMVLETLSPGQSLTVRGYLKPECKHKSSSLAAVIAWNVVKPGKPEVTLPAARAIVLGENQVQSESWWGRLSPDEVLKALGIPALLLLIGTLAGFGVNELNSRRDERVHRNELQSSLRSETWKQMLPVSHNYAAKFYLPLSLAAERFADSLEKKKHELAFFYLLFCGKKMIATRNEIGGFYFKDLRGETLAAQCWKEQRLACLGEEDTPFFAAVRQSIAQLEEIDSFEAFEESFVDHTGGAVHFSDDSMQQAWDLFQTWAANAVGVGKTTRYLKGFYAVLDFESNRPYEYWYDTAPRMVADDATENLLREMLAQERYSAKEVNEYFARVSRPS